MAKRQKKSKLLSIIIFLVVTLIGLLYMNIKSSNKRIIDLPRYMVIGKENVFVVYEDKLTLSIPFGIQLDGDNTIADLDKIGNYRGIMDGINELLPEKIDSFEVVKKGEIRLNVAHKYNVPEVMIEDKRYVLTSNLNSLFMKKYYKSNGKIAENVIVDVLNGNGKSGYAGRTGKKIEEALSYKYNAANYERDIEYSYIINKDLQTNQIEALIMSLDEKYIKIKSELDLPTLANAVIILGKENKIQTKINIHGVDKVTKSAKNILVKDGYKNISTGTQNGNLTVVDYRTEDYYIAYKIAKKLGIKNMVENNDGENNIINVYIKE
ncbi:LytR family transcriptional regulator [Psychrilyobacter sp.]|uniref:LytR family transcriptional regulator n=1 Tax=Psychrilyobacter sp. TaxID=2586924 RepID=UPI0030185924